MQDVGFRTLIAAIIGLAAFVATGLPRYLARRSPWVLPTVSGISAAVAAWLYDWWTERGGG